MLGPIYVVWASHKLLSGFIKNKALLEITSCIPWLVFVISLYWITGVSPIEDIGLLFLWIAESVLMAAALNREKKTQWRAWLACPDSVCQKSVDVPAGIIYIIICMVLTVAGNARLREIIYHCGGPAAGIDIGKWADWIGYRFAAIKTFFAGDISILEEFCRNSGSDSYMFFDYSQIVTYDVIGSCSLQRKRSHEHGGCWYA